MSGTGNPRHPVPHAMTYCPHGIPALPFCLLSLLLSALAFASAIVLSLIPVYISPRILNVNCISAPIPSIFNVDGGSLPSGQLTTNNRAALQTGLNGYLAGQRGFSRCSLQLINGNVDNCPSTGQILLTSRKRRQQSSSKRYVRQVSDSCVSQQIATTSTLNCGCTCVGICLRQRVDRLNRLLHTIRLPITFPDRISITVIIVGIDLPIKRPRTTITTSSVSANTTSTVSTISTTSVTSTATTTTTVTSTIPSTASLI